MIVFPNAKINLGLNIVAKRPDGYHNIESCFYPVGWADALEILPAPQLKFTSSGLAIPGHTDDNLCLRAYMLLDNEYNLPPVHIHLHKVVPIGAGLGGGSSDAAFTIKVLDSLFELQLNEYALENYARELGSDCAFFIRNKSALAYQKGDKLRLGRVNSLIGKYILLVYPNLHISTAEAYSNVVPKEPDMIMDEIIELPIKEWKDVMKNDFEKGLFVKYPILPTLKQQMYNAGALYAAMTGSGSTIFGIFDQEPDAKPFQQEKFLYWKGLL